MELQNQQQEGEQSQEQSLLDLCQYCDISSVEEEEKVLLYQVSGKKIMMKTMLMNKIIMEIIYTIFVIVYFAVEGLSMENKEEEILVQNL